MNGSCRVAVFQGAQLGFRMESVPIPMVTGSEILVAVDACTICGSDVHTLMGRRNEPTPSVLGHEMIGRIEAIGEEASHVDALGDPLQTGDRITWSLTASCGHCFCCTHELPQKCHRLSKYGHSTWTSHRELYGGFAEYCLLRPGTTIIRLPDSMSDALACPANCASATAMAALEAACLRDGQTVLILGAGMLGLTTARLAKYLAQVRTVVCDSQESRLEWAHRLGADEQLQLHDCRDRLRFISKYGPDCVIDTAGTTAAIEFGLESVRSGGRMVLVGSVFPDTPLTIIPETIVRRCLSIVGVHNYQPRHLIAAVKALSDPYLQPLEGLVGKWYALEDIEIAARTACHNPHFVRVGIRKAERLGVAKQ